MKRETEPPASSSAGAEWAAGSRHSVHAWLDDVQRSKRATDRNKLSRPVLLDNPSKVQRGGSFVTALVSRSERRHHRSGAGAVRGAKRERRRALAAPNDAALERALEARWRAYAREAGASGSSLGRGHTALEGSRLTVVECAAKPRLRGVSGVVLKETAAAVHLARGDEVVCVPKRPRHAFSVLVDEADRDGVVFRRPS